MKTVKFAILGCGKAGTKHVTGLDGLKYVKIEAVCDIDKLRAERMGKKYKCKYYYNIDELLQDTELDFVNVCTPSGMHAKHTIQSLNAGKNVLCEKPMALKESDALAMVKAAEKNKKLLFVVKQNRYNPPIKLLTRLMDEGKLGKPLMCVINMLWNRNEEYYKNDSWRGTIQFDGGTICSQVSHFIDLMLMIMGKPKSLSAYMGTQMHDIEMDDAGVVAVEFENEAFGSLNYTTCVTKKNIEGSMTLIFEKGTIKIGGEYLNEIDEFQVIGVDSYELEESTAGANVYGTYRGSMSNHSQVFKDIVAKINNPKEVIKLPTGKESVIVVKFAEKAIESARKNKKINF